MFKTIRVAGFAAAIATLCLHPGEAAAQAAPGATVASATPTAHAAALNPVLPADLDIQALPTNVAPAATSVQPSPVTSHIGADAALTPGRARPDRFDVSAATVPVTPSARPAVVISGDPVRRSLADLVDEHAGTGTPDTDFECLASAVYFESRGEPLEGQLAVAEVILNRVASGRFRATICDVVTQPSQFSFVRRGQIPAAPRESAAWHRAVAIAHIALRNLHDVTGDDSLFFHATYVRPAWGRANARIARIGRHIFYR